MATGIEGDTLAGHASSKGTLSNLSFGLPLSSLAEPNMTGVFKTCVGKQVFLETACDEPQSEKPG